MKRFIISGIIATAMAPIPAMADITVKLPANAGMESLNYNYTTIQKLATAKNRAERETVEAQAPVKDGVAVIPIGNDAGGYRFDIEINDKGSISTYAAPGDQIVAEVISLDPADYRLSGTPLIDGDNELDALFKPYIEQIKAIRSSENPDREKMQSIYNDYIEEIKQYIKENPTSPTACLAIMNLSGEDFLNAYTHLGERAKTSIVFPLVERQYGNVKKSVEKERKQAELSKGDVAAPNFTLKNLEGKEVSLSDFKGKWVILDFWGSWCPWCIKGFPELKEAYTKYKDILEIVGIDCRESEDAWRAGVAKYELPWVNVYNPESSSLLDDYAVQGFPTKAIINPEGIISNITVGHDPEFFNKLTELIGK